MKPIRCFALVTMLAPAPGAAQDYSTGLEAYAVGDFVSAWLEWRRLAEQGDAEAQTGLGGMYFYGRGVPRDFAKAAHWYQLAAEQGDADAQLRLGTIYRFGMGEVTQDVSKAAHWYRSAAEQGNADAQNSLGALYYEGLSVPQNYVTAHMWFNIAAANGQANAVENLDGVERRMTSADISRAQRRARMCINSGYQDCK